MGGKRVERKECHLRSTSKGLVQTRRGLLLLLPPAAVEVKTMCMRVVAFMLQETDQVLYLTWICSLTTYFTLSFNFWLHFQHGCVCQWWRGDGKTLRAQHPVYDFVSPHIRRLHHLNYMHYFDHHGKVSMTICGC